MKKINDKTNVNREYILKQAKKELEEEIISEESEEA